YALEPDLSVVSRHVERPPVELHVQPRRVARDNERGDAERLSRRARRARKHQVVAGTVHARVETLGAVEHPFLALAARRGLEPRGVGAVTGLGEAEREADVAPQPTLDERLLLRVPAQLVG